MSLASDTALRVAAAYTISARLDGAKVTVDSPIDVEAAEALADAIRGGLDDGTGVVLAVQSITITGDPPRVGGIKVTITGAPAPPSGLRCYTQSLSHRTRSRTCPTTITRPTANPAKTTTSTRSGASG